MDFSAAWVGSASPPSRYPSARRLPYGTSTSEPGSAVPCSAGRRYVKVRSGRSARASTATRTRRPVALGPSSDPGASRRFAAGLRLDDVPDVLRGPLRMTGLVHDHVVEVAGLRNPTLGVLPPTREAGLRLRAASTKALREVVHRRRHDEDEERVRHLAAHVAGAFRADGQDRVAAGGQDAAHLVDRRAVPVPMVVGVLEQTVAGNERLEVRLGKEVIV